METPYQKKQREKKDQEVAGAIGVEEMTSGDLASAARKEATKRGQETIPPVKYEPPPTRDAGESLATYAARRRKWEADRKAVQTPKAAGQAKALEDMDKPKQ